jgi:hypothetical protein
MLVPKNAKSLRSQKGAANCTFQLNGDPSLIATL